VPPARAGRSLTLQSACGGCQEAFSAPEEQNAGHGNAILGKRALLPGASTARENASVAKRKNMECTLRAGILKTLVDVTKDLVTSANFIFDETDGMRMQAMDSSRVSLISLVIKPSAFSSYRCATQSSLGIHFEALQVVLKSCAADDMLTMTWGQGDRVNISRGHDRQFELKLLEIENEILSISEQTYDVSATVPSSDFQKLCRDLKEIGETVRIDTSADGITLSVEGDVGKATATLKDGVSVEEGSIPTSSSYSARYLVAFSRGASLCSTVRIQMSADTPLRLTFGCESEQLTLFLAPRICD